MKNLQKLNRNSQKEILGGVRNGGIQKCDYHFECPGGSCCRNACMYNPCPEL